MEEGFGPEDQGKTEGGRTNKSTRNLSWPLRVRVGLACSPIAPGVLCGNKPPFWKAQQPCYGAVTELLSSVRTEPAEAFWVGELAL